MINLYYYNSEKIITLIKCCQINPLKMCIQANNYMGLKGAGPGFIMCSTEEINFDIQFVICRKSYKSYNYPNHCQWSIRSCNILPFQICRTSLSL